MASDQDSAGFMPPDLPEEPFQANPAPTPPRPQSPASVPPTDVAQIQDTIHATLDPTLQYVVDDIIRLPHSSVIHHQDEVYEILDLVTMSPSDISDITGRINGEEVRISKRDARLLLHFVWWHQDLSSQQLNSTIDNDVWFDYDRDDFTKFRREKVPALAAGGTAGGRRTPNTALQGDVGADTVIQFQRSIKMEISQYPDFKGSLEGWLPFKRKLMAITATHGIDRVLSSRARPIPGTQDSRLFQMQNNFLYSVFTQKLHGGPAILAMRQHEADKDARSVFNRLVDHYESKSNLMVISQKCHTKIQSLKLTRQFRGGAQAFVTQLQNAYLDLEYCTQTEKQDLEKKTTLLLAIEDSNYFAIRDNLAMDPTRGFLESLAAIDQHATMFIKAPSSSSNQTRNLNASTSGADDKPEPRKNNKKKTRGRRVNNTQASDNSMVRVESSVWEKLPGEVRKFIAEHNRSIRDKNKGNSNKDNDNKGNDTRRANQATTNADDDTSSSEQGEEGEDKTNTPSLRAILRAASKNQKSKQTAFVTRNAHKKQEEAEEEELMLVDTGADTCVLGPAFKIISSTDRKVDMVGAQSDMVREDLVIGSGVTLATLENGKHVILRFNESLINNKEGKSIIGVNQVRHYQHEINERAKIYGGLQNIVTLDEDVIPLVFHQSMTWLNISYPTDEDLTKYPIIEMTSDVPWDPSQSGERPIAPMTKKKPPDLQQFRRCLGWKPEKVIKKTIEGTTQYASSTMRIPMRQRFKARNRSLFVRRLRETVATDTFFSSETGLYGEQCAQLYVGKTSKLTEVFGMTTKSQMPETLQDFIRKWGAPDALLSDNAQEQTSRTVKRILREYGIMAMYTEPHHPNQNPAERRIQDVKKMSNVIMDRTDSPADLWYLSVEYSAYLLNHLANETLDWKTPIEVATGETPDISNLLQFHWYQKVYYYDPKSSYPGPKEKLGHFVGIAENVGDTLTYKILTSDTREVIHRSVVRAVESEDKNLRADKTEEDDYESKNQFIFNESDVRDNVNYPEIDMEQLVGFTFVKQDGEEHYRAEVIKHLEELDDKYLVKVGDSGREEIMHYNDLVEEWEKNQSNQNEDIWTFKEIIDHRRRNRKNEVKVLWDDDTETWEPLSVIGRQDPVTCAQYAFKADILHLNGWKRFRRYSPKGKIMLRAFRRVMKLAADFGVKYQFGVRVPRNYQEAIALDKANGNTLWQDAMQKELDQIKEYETFIVRKDLKKPPPGYQFVRVHFVYAVKHDLRHKARLVGNGSMTVALSEDAYSSVVSLKGMRMCVLLAELNGLKIMAGDVGNAYLEAFTKEKVYIIAGPEFGELEGTIMIVNKALYGLKTSGARYREHFADYLRAEGWSQSRADPDIWMKDKGDHWEYICTYVDDILVMSKEPELFMETLQKTFKMKGVGPPSYHLGADFVRHENGKLSWGSKTYVKKILSQFERLFPDFKFSKRVATPLEPGDHPEIDDSELLDAKGIKIYQSLIGMLQWAVTLGRFDVQCAVMTMSRFRAIPREGHLARAQRIFNYLSNYKDATITFDVEVPEHSVFKVEQPEWKYVYGECREQIPENAPEAKGKPITITSFVDANLMHCMATGRSASGVLHMLNKTPIEWFSKRQNQVETATYGSEFMAMRIGTEQIIELRYMLRMLGVPIEGPSWIFGDNQSVIINSTLPSSTLKKRWNALSYHRVREAVAAGIINVVHLPGTENPADVLTKFLPHRTLYKLVKEFLFWGYRRDPTDQGEGSVKSSKN